MKHVSRRILGRELLLLMSPLLAVGAVAFFFWWRAQSGPRLLETPTPVSKVWFLPDNRIFAIGSSAVKGNTNVPTQLYVWDARSEKLLISRMHDVQTRDSSLSPDEKLWVYGVAAPATGAVVGMEVRDIRDFSLVLKSPLTLSFTSWNGERELEGYNSATRKFERYTVDEKNHRLNYVGAKLKSKEWPKSSPDGKWKVEREVGQEHQFDYDDIRYSNTQNVYFYKREMIFRSSNGQFKTRRTLGNWNATRWTRDSKIFLGVVNLRPSDIKRDDIVRFDAATGTLSSVRLQGTDYNDWRNAEFSSDGHFLVSSRERGQIWEVWNARTGQLLRSIGKAVDKPNWSADATPRLSPDGKFWVRPTQKGVELWDLAKLAG